MTARRTAGDLREAVAWACRILAYHGHGDLTLGHVSARDGDRVYMKRKGLGLEEITPADVLTLDLNGGRLRGEGAVHLEVPLHTEVYRARPDVGAVIHTHPIHTTARRAVLLRNHGVLVTGRDVRWAVLSALTLERAVQMQVVAATLGTPTPIPDQAVGALHASKYRDEVLDEYWAYWVRCVRRVGLDRGMPPARRALRKRRGQARRGRSRSTKPRRGRRAAGR